jgi:single-strand DNA-binding protein
MNSVNIIGRLTRDPEEKKPEDGKTVCNYTIAIDDPHSKDERADFIRITVFGPQAERCMKYLRKGFQTGVEGHMHSSSYTDADGVKRYPVTVIADRVQFLQWPEREVKKEDVSPEQSVREDRDER